MGGCYADEMEQQVDFTEELVLGRYGEKTGAADDEEDEEKKTGAVADEGWLDCSWWE